MQEKTEQDLSELEYFNKNYNISYYDESLPTPSNDLIFMHYISSCMVYAFFTMFVLFNPFYVNLYAKYVWAKEIVIILFLSYLVIAPIILFTVKPKTIYASHSIQVINYFLKIFKREGLKKDYTSTEFLEWIKPTYHQQQSFLLYFVKLYFGPQFVLYTCMHFFDANHYWKIFITTIHSLPITEIFTHLESFLNANLKIIYNMAFFSLYLIDCLMFAIGYCTELCILRNRIRSVESTPLGLFFCLICYTPIGGGFWFVMQWNHNERGLAFTQHLWINVALCLISLLVIALYVAASVALFTKGSNLTNRGTVSCFPYNIVRHPAYVTKITGWSIASIPVLYEILHNEHVIRNLILYIIGAVTLSFVYYMRAITEERHLSKDPEYRAYTKKVQYKFIPHVW